MRKDGGVVSSIDPHRLSELLAHIYDCVLNPERWGVALGAICSDLDLLHAVLGYYETPTGKPLLRMQSGMQREWFDRMPAYGPDMAAYWGGSDRIRAFPVGEVIAHSIAQPDMDYSDNRFVAEWCEPQGVADLIGTTVVLDPTGLGSLVLTSETKIADGREYVLDLLRLLVPHVRRAVTISKILDLKTIEAAGFEAALSALPNGLILLDADMRVLYANAAASKMLDTRDIVYLGQGKLRLHDEGPVRTLEAAVASATNMLELGQRGIGIGARSRSGAGVVLHVLPLSHGLLRASLDSRAVAALFITSAANPPRLPADALSSIYDLTPAEVRICELIAQGNTPTAVATQIGIAPSTAKTHLLRIFAKTGTNRQADLVRLCASLSIPT